MIEEPSRTAMGAAAHRAIHQLLEEGRVFNDPLAVSLLGWPPDELRKRADERPEDRGLRFFIAARSELAEAKLAEVVAKRGVAQAVIIGAGLDTFAYRNPFGDRLSVFEIDHPATQRWKRERLANAGIAAPRTVSFVPADLEKTDLVDALAEGRFDFAGRAFFLWLGTVPYLTARAIEQTLTTIGGLPAGAELVFDYAEPLSDDASPTAERFRALRDRVAAAGEPFVSFFHPADLQAALAAAGFEHIEDHTVRALAERYLGAEVVAARAQAGTPFPDRGGHVVFASTN
jgi:methyltransferase (TIGR00027 family)